MRALLAWCWGGSRSFYIKIPRSYRRAATCGTMVRGMANPKTRKVHPAIKRAYEREAARLAALEPTASCSGCGSTDPEDLYSGDQGYTACCNEPINYGRVQS